MLSEPSQTGRGVPRHFRPLGSDRQELLLSKQETGKREMSLPFCSGRMVSHQNLCKTSDHFFERERCFPLDHPQDMWPGILLNYRSWPGLQTPLPRQEGCFSGILPAQLKRQAGTLRSPSSKLCECMLLLGRGSKGSSWKQMASVGMFHKPETLSTHGKEEGNPLFVEEAPGTTDGTDRFLRPQTPFHPGQTEGSL